MKAPYHVSWVEKKHLAQLVILERQCFVQTWTIEQYQKMLSRNNFKVLGIFQDTMLAGYISISLTGDEAEIISLAVHPEHRKMGLAKTLLSRAISICCQAMATKIFLEVRPSNIPALKVYKSSGFYEVARRKKYYQDNLEDALILSLELTAPERF